MSSLFKLNGRDFFKGLLMAILTAGGMYVAEKIGWVGLDATAVSAAVAYLVNQLFSDEQGKLGGVL